MTGTVGEPGAHVPGAHGAHAAPASVASATPAVAYRAVKPKETVEQVYLRHTRNATVFIAVMVGIVCVLSLIGAIMIGTQLAKVNSQLGNLGNGTSTSSNCLSQGGTDPTC